MIKYEENLAARINGANLQPLAGASVTVTDNANGLPAVLYSDNGVTQMPQPLTTNDEGYFGFYAADGKYTLTFSGARFATFTRQIVMEDPDDNPYLTAQALALGNGSAAVGFMQEGEGASLRTVQDELRERVSVTQFAAKGDGVTNDSAAVQAAMDAVSDAGGGTIHFPFTPDGYLAYNISARNGVTLAGDPGTRIYKPTGVQAAILKNPNAVADIPVDDFGIDQLIFDGNDTGTENYSVSAVSLDGCRRIRISRSKFMRATGYGLAMQAYPEQGSGINGPQEDIYIEDCDFAFNGFSATADKHDGLDIKKSSRVTVRGIRAYGNADKGWDIRGTEVSVDGAISYDNDGDGFEILSGSGNRVSRCAISNIFSFDNGGAGGLIALAGVTGVDSISRYAATNVFCFNNAGDGLKTVEGGGTTTGLIKVMASNVHLYGNGGHGLNNAIANAKLVMFNGLECTENGGSGISNVGRNLKISGFESTGNAQYGYAESGASTGNRLINGDCQSNTVGAASLGGTETIAINVNGVDSSMDHTTVASAKNAFSWASTAANVDPVMSIKGSDANRGGMFLSKGAGQWTFSTNGNIANIQFKVIHTGSPTSYLQATGSSAGVPSLSAQGAATDADLVLTPKGTGRVRFGSLTVNADTPVTGYIEVKDAGGTLRKLAVIG